jgi:hypothetical protein
MAGQDSYRSFWWVRLERLYDIHYKSGGYRYGKAISYSFLWILNLYWSLAKDV